MPEVLRKVLHSVIRNRNLGTLFTASYSTACVWWPNTETSSLQHPVLLRNYTDCSGTRVYRLDGRAVELRTLIMKYLCFF